MGMFKKRIKTGQGANFESGSVLEIGGTQVTANAAELNALDNQGAVAADFAKLHAVTATATELNVAADKAIEVAAADGPATISNGVIWMEKAVPGVVALTIADPAAGDNFKTLTIVGGTAHAHTVTYASGFSGAGGSKDVATYGGAVGDSMTIMAYNSLWHVVALNGVTVA